MGHRKIKRNYRRTVLRLPDLDHSKLAVLNSLSSPASRRVYEYAIDQFIAWYCSEPRLAFALCLVAVPAVAQVVYSNGPINGTTDGWTINFGFVVSDTFTVGSGGATITGLTFGAWLFPGDD